MDKHNELRPVWNLLQKRGWIVDRFCNHFDRVVQEFTSTSQRFDYRGLTPAQQFLKFLNSQQALAEGIDVDRFLGDFYESHTVSMTLPDPPPQAAQQPASTENPEGLFDFDPHGQMSPDLSPSAIFRDQQPAPPLLQVTEAQALHELKVGDVLDGEYKVEKRIGEGAQGEVFRGLDLTLCRKVGIKRLISPDPSELDAEAQMTARFKAPGLVSIYRIIKDGGAMNLILEWVTGRTARENIKRRLIKAIPAQTALRWWLQIVVAISVMHRLRVMHGDLKPENVMIDSEGNAIVLDFGIARRFGQESANPEAAGLKGSPRYMAPEQIINAPPCGATDVYALGLMGYELLTGVNPNIEKLKNADTAGVYGTLKHIAKFPEGKGPTQKYLISQLLKAGAPKGEAKIIAKCLQPHTKDRYPDATVLAEEVKTEREVEKHRQRLKARLPYVALVILIPFMGFVGWGYTLEQGRANAEAKAATQAKRAQVSAEQARDAQAKLATQALEQVMMGRQHSKAGEASRGSDYVKASELFEALLKKWPDEHPSRLDWAHVLWIISERKRAVEQYEILANNQEVEPVIRDTARFWIAWITIQQQDLFSLDDVPALINKVKEGNRRTILKGFLALAQADAFAKKGLGDLMNEKYGEAASLLDPLFMKEGRMHYEAVGVKKSDRWLVYCLMGYANMRSDLELALNYFGESLASSPSNTTALRLRGKIFLEYSEKLADGGQASLAARSDLLRLVTISPGMEKAQFYHLRALCSMAQGGKALHEKLRWLNRASTILDEREKRHKDPDGPRKQIDWLMRTSVQVGLYQAHSQAGNRTIAEAARKLATKYAGAMHLMTTQDGVPLTENEKLVRDSHVRVLGLEAIKEAAQRLAEKKMR